MASVTTERRATAREVLTFRVALAVIAVAVLDDAFGHPEPGTGPGDHLVSGLAPVAAAVMLGWAYPRLRPGARAVAALCCGVLAVVAAVVDGARHIAVDRLSGDDLTVLLAGVVGAGMIIGAIGILWRTRRLDDPPLRRYARRAAIGLAALLAGFFVLFPLAFAIVATHKARAPVAAADLGRPYERVTLRTGDGLRLAGWYVPSRNRAAVIVFPGRSGPVPHARVLARHGYGVLMLDRRGEGGSEGELNLFGWNGEGDLRAAISFLRARHDVDAERIGGLGLSVGGELLLQAAARDPRLRAVVSEGAGVRSLAEHLSTPGVGRLQRWGTPWIVQTAAVAVLSGTTPPTDLADLATRIGQRPVLLIHSRDGNPDEILNRVYADRIGSTATLWTLQSGGHTGALATDPTEYERRVVGFLDRALLPVRP
jgi:poly(3-hydroxybutyrate) depolymerase